LWKRKKNVFFFVHKSFLQNKPKKKVVKKKPGLLGNMAMNGERTSKPAVTKIKKKVFFFSKLLFFKN